MNYYFCDPDLIQTDSVLKQIKKSQLQFHRVMTSSSLEVIASLVNSGAGVGVLPTRVAQNEALRLDLKAVKNAPEFQDRHSLIFRADTQTSKANRQLGREIEQILKK
ncbi:hypothetical protein EBT16_06690 [bacterium]|nr:hypothetical protein [bacterium]